MDKKKFIDLFSNLVIIGLVVGLTGYATGMAVRANIIEQRLAATQGEIDIQNWFNAQQSIGMELLAAERCRDKGYEFVSVSVLYGQYYHNRTFLDRVIQETVFLGYNLSRINGQDLNLKLPMTTDRRTSTALDDSINIAPLVTIYCKESGNMGALQVIQIKGW